MCEVTQSGPPGTSAKTLSSIPSPDARYSSSRAALSGWPPHSPTKWQTSTAAAYPRRGWRAVAAVDLPDDGRFRIRKTLGPGHYTVWGDAADLLACVIEYNPL